jgi:hypothetical protein
MEHEADHPYLVPGLRINKVIPSLPPHAFIILTGTALLLNFTIRPNYNLFYFFILLSLADGLQQMCTKSAFLYVSACLSPFYYTLTMKRQKIRLYVVIKCCVPSHSVQEIG